MGVTKKQCLDWATRSTADGAIFVLPLFPNPQDLRNRITAAVALADRDMLTRVWDEMDYHLPCNQRWTHRGSVKYVKKNLVRLTVFQCNKIWYPLVVYLLRIF
jgi:hypothetical protein